MLPGEVDADAAVVPADVLSRQALEAQAGDLAIEDALYAVEKALQAGAITPDVYIKQARLHTLGPFAPKLIRGPLPPGTCLTSSRQSLSLTPVGAKTVLYAMDKALHPARMCPTSTAR